MLAKVAGCSALLSVMSSRHEAFDPTPWICSVAGHFQQTCRVNGSRVQTPAVQLRWSRWPSGLTLCLTAVQGVQGLTTSLPPQPTGPECPSCRVARPQCLAFLRRKGDKKK